MSYKYVIRQKMEQAVTYTVTEKSYFQCYSQL